jgi:GH25 family lysozyme M1 (1,4-beta-N-acetylmuramidase)
LFNERIKSNFWQSGVYTNRGFIYDFAPNMNKWLGSYPAWVAHYGRQPGKKIMITWEQLKRDWLPNYDIILSSGQTNVVGHQFTGDRCLLPGVYNKFDYLPFWPNKGRLPMDVSVFTQLFIDSCRTIHESPRMSKL